MAAARILVNVSPTSSFACDLPDSLLRRARDGEEAAFEQIYRRFERPIYALALRLLGDADEAMDVVHDTMLKLFRHLDRYRGEAPFWAWVRQIASHEALGRLRRQQPLQFCDELPEPAQAELDGAGPSVLAEGSALERALGRLPAATRAVLWLYHVEGLTHDEIGSSMGRTVSFSKSQLARGTRRLRELLQVPQEAIPHA